MFCFAARPAWPDRDYSFDFFISSLVGLVCLVSCHSCHSFIYLQIWWYHNLTNVSFCLLVFLLSRYLTINLISLYLLPSPVLMGRGRLGQFLFILSGKICQAMETTEYTDQRCWYMYMNGRSSQEEFEYGNLILIHVIWAMVHVHCIIRKMDYGVEIKDW